MEGTEETRRKYIAIIQENGSIIVALALRNHIIMGSDTRVVKLDGSISMIDGREKICPKILAGRYWLMAICGLRCYGEYLHKTIKQVVGESILPAVKLGEVFEERMIDLANSWPNKNQHITSGVIGGMFDYHNGVPESKLIASGYTLDDDKEHYDSGTTYPTQFYFDGVFYGGLQQFLDDNYREDMTEEEGKALVRTCINMAAGNAQQSPTRRDVIGGSVHLAVMRALSESERAAGVQMTYILTEEPVVPL